MPPSHICQQVVSDCLTLDKQPGIQVLENARSVFPDTSLHNNNESAVNNLLKALNTNPAAKTVMIIGIGVPGALFTGPKGNDHPPDDAELISAHNVSSWRPLLQQLRGRITEIVFCSCNTALGPDGTLLLQALADVTLALASGFTGFIFPDQTGGVRCEKTGVWRHFAPLAQPVFETPMAFAWESAMKVNLKSDAGYTTVETSSSSRVSYFQTTAAGRKEVASLEAEEAESILGLVNLVDPFEMPGPPLAVVTGELSVRYGAVGEERVREFVIYNNLLLQDKVYPETYYMGSPQFTEALSRMSRNE